MSEILRQMSEEARAGGNYVPPKTKEEFKVAVEKILRDQGNWPPKRCRILCHKWATYGNYMHMIVAESDGIVKLAPYTVYYCLVCGKLKFIRQGEGNWVNPAYIRESAKNGGKA